MVVTDNSPSFPNDFVAQLQSLNVDHSYSEAYIPSKIGCSERLVGLVKHMIELKPPTGNPQLQELVQAMNARARGVQGAGTAYERLLGRKPLLDLPSLPSELSPQQWQFMQRKMSDHREKYRCRVKHKNKELFELGKHVFIFIRGKSLLVTRVE